MFVSVVSGLSRYSAGLGSGSAFQGKVFGFLGEALKGQLPAIIMKTGGLGAMEPVLVPKSHRVPEKEAIATHYASQSAATLMSVIQAMPQMQIAKLAILPARWAPYFLDRKSPHEAYLVISDLVAGLSTQAQRDAVEPLLDWCRASCCREGGTGEARGRSQLNVKWERPPVMEARFLRWAKGRFEKYSLPEPPAPVPIPPMPPAGAPAATDSAETRNFSEMEHTQIRSDP